MLNTYEPNTVREQLEDDRRWELSRRRHRILGVSVFFLAVLIAGLGWLAWRVYPTIQRHDASLQRLPGVIESVDGLDHRLTDSDSRLTSWAARQEELHAQLDRTGRDLRVRMEAAKKQASDATSAMIERVQSQVATQIDGIKTRLAHLENSSESDQAKISTLQQELSQVRTQMAEQASAQSRELAAVRGQVDENASTSGKQFASIEQNQQHDRKDFDSFADKLAMKRVEFEVAKNHSAEVTPGISVGMNSTDISYQKASGWVWVMPDRHTIWLRQLAVQEPVLLNSTPDGRKRELVITRVNKNSVLGYVVVPAAESAAN